ncbi:hypothetical protein VNO78_32521 [Psophocarpus tetragonolobus]|uniref:ZF-HD dimerization-type domain-containing protein n=1 Tax=Psophocarpus tetragonolobus TaxID=3891 RepID=A0AAN9P0Y7_PSOTE
MSEVGELLAHTGTPLRGPLGFLVILLDEKAPWREGGSGKDVQFGNCGKEEEVNIKREGRVILKEKKEKKEKEEMEKTWSSSCEKYMYRECLRNHAASLGSYATDGCGEYSVEESSLQCAACGCHRNFHRKVAVEGEMMMEYSTGGGKKRFRSKFSSEQKEKMLAFAEKLGWKLQRKEVDDDIDRFCKTVGVTRQVFKVWMHNHKNNSNSSNLSSLTQ